MAINQESTALSASDYKKIIEAYKEQNPEKYKAKKEALEAKMKAAK